MSYNPLKIVPNRKYVNLSGQITGFLEKHPDDNRPYFYKLLDRSTGKIYMNSGELFDIDKWKLIDSPGDKIIGIAEDYQSRLEHLYFDVISESLSKLDAPDQFWNLLTNPNYDYFLDQNYIDTRKLDLWKLIKMNLKNGLRNLAVILSTEARQTIFESNNRSKAENLKGPWMVYEGAHYHQYRTYSQLLSEPLVFLEKSIISDQGIKDLGFLRNYFTSELLRYPEEPVSL